MACHITYARGNQPFLFMCDSSTCRPRQKCVRCGEPAEQLCDGRGCNAPLCGGCTPSIRAIDRDFCPKCADAPLEGQCQVGGIAGASVPCRGVLVEDDGLCVRHAVLFDEWCGHHGGMQVYRDDNLPREAKRQRFRAWLAALPSPEVNAILEKRHSVPGDWAKKDETPA